MQVGEYTSLAFMLPAATLIGYAIGKGQASKKAGGPPL